MAAGLGSLMSGYRIGLIAAAVAACAGALTMAVTVPAAPKRAAKR